MNSPTIRHRLLLCFALAALAAVLYYPVADAEFIVYDDDVYVYDNPNVLAGLTAESIRWAFLTSRAGNWHPLTWLSLMADATAARKLGLSSPSGQPDARLFHVTNIALHAAGTVLVYLALFALTGYSWRSAAVAALFAVHPLHVESVAWVAERKDVLSAFFWFAAILVYARWVRSRSAGWYAAAAGLLALGLMAKPMLVTLPVVLLLLDCWPLKRERNWRLLAEKAPLFVLAAASSALTIWAQSSARAVGSLQAIPLGERLANAAVACVGYLVKAVRPAGLSVFYPHPGDTLPVWQVAGSAALIFAVTWAVVRWRNTRPYLALGWFWYLVTLVPVSGIVQVGRQASADRYTYIPLIGIFIAAAWGLPDVLQAAGSDRRRRAYLSALCAAAVIGAFAASARSQMFYWQDSVRLFSRAVEVAPKSGLARYNLAVALTRAGDTRGALKHYRIAARLLPNEPDVRVNYGCALAALNDFEGAREQFLAAVRLDPKDPRARVNLGISYASAGEIDRAVEQFRKAAVLDPGSPVIRQYLKQAEALRLRLNPDRGKVKGSDTSD